MSKYITEIIKPLNREDEFFEDFNGFFIPLLERNRQRQEWWMNNNLILGPTPVPPVSPSTDNAVARWNGTTGNLLQNSGVIIDDSNNVSGVNKLLVGATANFTDFSNANTVISKANTGLGDAGNVALAVENAGTTGNIEGIVSYVNNTSGGNLYAIAGYCYPANTGGYNVAVKGFCYGTSSGTNIGGDFSASGGNLNYAIQLSGDTHLQTAGNIHYIHFDTPSGGTNYTVIWKEKGGYSEPYMSFMSYSGGSAGDMNAITLSQRTSIGYNSARFASFPGAKLIVDNGDSSANPITDTVSSIGIVGQCRTQPDVAPGIGVWGIGVGVPSYTGIGVKGTGLVSATGNGATVYGGYFEATATHAGGANVAVYAKAANGAINYNFYGDSATGVLYNAGLAQLYGGVSFGSSSQTTLANYYESTFAPTVTLVGGAGNTVPVYSTKLGRYTRVGNRIFVDIQLQGDGGDEGAGTGQINIALPISVSASAVEQFTSCGLGFNNATGYLLIANLVPGSSTIKLDYWSNISTRSTFTGALQNNTTRYIFISFNYEVA